MLIRANIKFRDKNGDVMNTDIIYRCPTGSHHNAIKDFGRWWGWRQRQAPDWFHTLLSVSLSEFNPPSIAKDGSMGSSATPPFHEANHKSLKETP